jgi:hypothetical protein
MGSILIRMEAHKLTSIFDSFKSLIGSLTDEEPKPPLHTGEVMSLWTLLTVYQEGQMIYNVALNTTQDPELLHAVHNAVKESRECIHALEQFFKTEGIPLPSPSDQKPDSSPDQIPFGVRFTDEELANLIVGKITSCIAICGQAIAQCLRNDVGIVLLRQMAVLLNFGIPYKSLMRKRGWLKTPPEYSPPGKAPQS